MPRPGPGAEVAPASSGSLEATAPMVSTPGLRVVPALRASVTRSWYDVSPPGARQVSTLTSARSSPWLPKVWRCRNRSLLAQRPSRSQLDVRPAASRPRTRISTKLSPGVTADQEAISSVKAKPGSTQAEFQVEDS